MHVWGGSVNIRRVLENSWRRRRTLCAHLVQRESTSGRAGDACALGATSGRAQVTAGSIPGVTPECTWMLTCTSGSHQRRSGCANMIWVIAHLGTHLEISHQRVPPNPGLRWPHIWPSAHIWNAQLHLHPWGCPDSTQCAGSHPMCRIPALPATPNLHSGGLGCDALFIHPSLSSPGMAKVNKY